MKNLSWEEIWAMPYDKVVARVKLWEKNTEGENKFRIAVIRNVAMEAVAPYLRLFCFENGLAVEVFWSGFGNPVSEIHSEGSWFQKLNPQLTVLCFDAKTMWPEWFRDFSELNISTRDERVGVAEKFFKVLTDEVRSFSQSPLLIKSFEFPEEPSSGLKDPLLENGETEFMIKLNHSLLNVLKNSKGQYLLDSNKILMRCGVERYYDERYRMMARAPYSREAMKHYGWEIARYALALTGRSKKCLVLDCDGTLWGGIVGEDGVAGIKLDQEYPGLAYVEFQREILKLKNRGVILAIVSKNNAIDVREVLDRHPHMLLKEKDFVSLKIDWEDKAGHLREISLETGVALDQMVFLDDSDHEIDKVRKNCPEVVAIKMPRDPSQFARMIRSLGLFETLSFTGEDADRSRLVQEKIQRDRIRDESRDPDDFLKSLEGEVCIIPMNEETLGRVAQLTQRTNQFNLKTRRFSESELQEWVTHPGRIVLTATFKDRFGDQGLIGIAMLDSFGDEIHVENFLLSCRIIGYRIEEALLAACGEWAKKQGAKCLVGTYLETAKNSLVSGFYQKMGFILKDQRSGRLDFSLELEGNGLARPACFKNIIIPEFDNG